MKKLTKLLGSTLVAGLVLTAGQALAQNVGTDNTGAFAIVTERLLDAFNGSRTTVMIIGGFGLIAVAFLAIFGKVHWKWFAGLLVGLAVIAAAGLVIDYIVGEGEAGVESTGEWQ